MPRTAFVAATTSGGVARICLTSASTSVPPIGLIANLAFNCVNFGLPALEHPGLSLEFEEGDGVEFRLNPPRIVNLRTGRILTPRPIPAALQDMMLGGGLYPLLERMDLILPAERRVEGEKVAPRSD